MSDSTFAGRIRADFPVFERRIAGRPIAFFDGPGGTQVPDTVIDAVVRYYRESNANHGGAFATSERSDAIVEDAHQAIADLLGVDIADCVAIEDSPPGAASAVASVAVVLGVEHAAPLVDDAGYTRATTLRGVTVADLRRLHAAARDTSRPPASAL